MYIFENPNPAANRTEDCTLRALCILEGWDWLKGYWQLCAIGAQMYIMPNNDKAVVKSLLLRNGYRSHSLPDTCPDCYTVRDFCRDNPKGRYLLVTGNHAVAVIDGNYYDGWDSGDEIPVYVWHKEEQ